MSRWKISEDLAHYGSSGDSLQGTSKVTRQNLCLISFTGVDRQSAGIWGKGVFSDMATNGRNVQVTVGVLALQGAFSEHIQLLRQAAKILANKDIVKSSWSFIEIRVEAELLSCDALIIPGGESTAISLVAQRSNMLEPLRNFVK